MGMPLSCSILNSEVTLTSFKLEGKTKVSLQNECFHENILQINTF